MLSYSPSEERSTSGLLGVLLVMKMLEDDQCVVLKAYKFTILEACDILH